MPTYPNPTPTRSVEEHPSTRCADSRCMHSQVPTRARYPFEPDSEGESEHWYCRSCGANHGNLILVNDDGYRSFRFREDTFYLRDGGYYVSREFAEERCYQDSQGEWYRHEPEPEPEDEEDDAPLYDYSTNVLSRCRFDQRRAAAGELLFGVELEMEARERTTTRELVNALGGRLGDRHILKHDGSLDMGAELVTIPMTLEEHRNFEWEKLLAPALRIAHSGRGTTHCGIHVHINRKALSPLQIGKMLVFLNADSMSDLVTLIAQRGSNGYCSRDTGKKVTDGGRRSYNRYDLLNVSGAHTVEVRMFRGNLRWERVLKNVEFCAALVHYCRDVSIQDVDKPALFLKWIVSHCGEYPLLVAFLRERSVLSRRQCKPEFAAAAIADA